MCVVSRMEAVVRIISLFPSFDPEGGDSGDRGDRGPPGMEVDGDMEVRG